MDSNNGHDNELNSVDNPSNYEGTSNHQSSSNTQAANETRANAAREFAETTKNRYNEKLMYNEMITARKQQQHQQQQQKEKNQRKINKNEYEIDDISSHAVTKHGNINFKVHFEGYNAEDDEFVSNLKANELIFEYATRNAVSLLIAYEIKSTANVNATVQRWSSLFLNKKIADKRKSLNQNNNF